MPKLTINLTDFEFKVLAHRDVDVREQAEIVHKQAAAKYARQLGMKIVDAEQRKDSPGTLPMDAEGLANTILEAKGYLNAAERKAYLDKKSVEEENPQPSPFLNLIV